MDKQSKHFIMFIVRCPFCQRSGYSVVFRGPMTKEEREREEWVIALWEAHHLGTGSGYKSCRTNASRGECARNSSALRTMETSSSGRLLRALPGFSLVSQLSSNSRFRCLSTFFRIFSLPCFSWVSLPCFSWVSSDGIPWHSG